jgi:hypothetical protein
MKLHSRSEKIVEVDQDPKVDDFYYAEKKQQQPQSFYNDYAADDIVKDCSQSRKSQRKMLEKLHRTMARSGATALLASAHMLSERIEEWDEASKFRNLRRRAKTQTIGRQCQIGKCGRKDHRDDCLRSGSIVVEILLAIVANILAQVRSMLVSAGKAAAVIGNAIGEPPRRNREGRGAEEDGPEAGQDMPLAIVWLINFMVICGFAIICQTVMAFAVQDGAYEDEEGAGLGSDSLDATRVNWRVRLVSLASFSFVAGMGVSPIHPLQSALLCGV